MKISLIGAGSSSFSVNMIRDVCLCKSLDDVTFSLMDINREKLDRVVDLCRRYAKSQNRNITIEGTRDRRKALQGADFVINTCLAAGYDKLRKGLAIAKKHGYRYGGSMHVVHDEAFWINFYQYRLMEAIARDLLEICPNAWYLLVANPVITGVTYLSRKYPELKIAGMCHGFAGAQWVADMIGLKLEHVTFEIAGVNHFVWLTDLRYKGKDAYPLLDRWIREQGPKYGKSLRGSTPLCLKACDLYKRYGLLPVGDLAIPAGGGWPFWYHVDRKTEKRWNEDPEGWWNGIFTGIDGHARRMQDATSDPNFDLAKMFRPYPSGEPMVPFIESAALNLGNKIIVNVLNKGLPVQGIPEDFQVELYAVVDAQGVHPCQTKPLPKPIIASILRERVAPVEMEIAAFTERRYDLLLELLMMDPWTRSRDQAQALLDDILALPFNTEMKRYYTKGTPR